MNLIWKASNVVFAKQKTKFGGGGKARAGKNSFPPTPFLFARPSVKVFQNSAFGFSLKKVRISFNVRSERSERRAIAQSLVLCLDEKFMPRWVSPNLGAKFYSKKLPKIRQFFS